MAFSHGSQAVTSIDASEGGALTAISQYLTNVSFSAEREISEIRPQGGTAVSQMVGPVASTFTLEGGFDPTVHAMFQTAMSAASPVTRTFEHGPAGSATGAPKIGAEVYVASYETESDSENPNTWTSELVVSGSVTYGTY